MQAEAAVLLRLIREKGELEIPSRGVSMFPLIREGDRCRFVPLTEAPRLGDILLVAEAGGRLVGHRLVRIAGAGEEVLYICKGDSNVNPDAPAVAGQIIGKLADIRRGRSARSAVQADKGMARFSVQADKGMARWWGRLLVRWPGLSRLVRGYLRAERRLGRMRRGKGGYGAADDPPPARQTGAYEHPRRGKERGSL